MPHRARPAMGPDLRHGHNTHLRFTVRFAHAGHTSRHGFLRGRAAKRFRWFRGEYWGMTLHMCFLFFGEISDFKMAVYLPR